MEISLDGAEELSKHIRALIKYVQNPIVTFKKAKVRMLADVMQHFQRQESPDGKWEKLSKLTILRRRGSGKGTKILQDTGRLRESIEAVSSNKGAEVGTNMIYARTHQNGDETRNIPQRTFVWLSEQTGGTIADDFIADMKDIQ